MRAFSEDGTALPGNVITMRLHVGFSRCTRIQRESQPDRVAAQYLFSAASTPVSCNFCMKVSLARSFKNLGTATMS